MPVALNTADRAAMRRSAASARHMPAAEGRPVDRGDHGLGDAAQRQDQPAVGPHRPLRDAADGQAVDARQHAVVLEVEARAEPPAGAGEHDDPGVVLLADRGERLVERERRGRWTGRSAGRAGSA